LTPLVPLDRAAVFFDGGRTPVRLRHAECVAIDAAGDVWCGGESGEIYRIDRDGAALELVASNNGATLGIAFDEAGYLYVCDAFVGAVDRLDPRSGELRRFARVDPGAIRIPNFPVVAHASRLPLRQRQPLVRRGRARHLEIRSGDRRRRALVLPIRSASRTE